MQDESKIKDLQFYSLAKTKRLGDQKKKVVKYWHRFETTQLKLWYAGVK